MRSSKLKDRRRRKPALHRRDRINILLEVLLCSITDYYIYRYWWNTRISPFIKKSYLHRAQWRYHFYLSCVRILVWPWLPTYYPITIELLAQARGRFLIWNFIHKMASRCEDSTIFLFFIRILTFSNRKCKYHFLYFSFITLYPFQNISVTGILQ